MIATSEDVDGMRAAGSLAAQLLLYLQTHIKPGISTEYLNQLAANWTKEAGATSAPLNYKGSGKTPFPAHICTSVNEVACHGIPSNILLKSGDIINVDVTPILNGYHGDTSNTFPVGNCSKEALSLIKVTEECLSLAIEAAKPGVHLGTIGYLISKHANINGFNIVKEFGGHGIGKKFHTQPFVSHYGIPNTGLKLKSGMIFTIEPILCAGDPIIEFINDWEVKTKYLTAQAEHTILITDNGAEILTK